MNFSVLMSVYAKENPGYLDEALCSIWDKQTLKPGQIVLVKDGLLTAELDDCIGKWKEKLSDLLSIVELPENVGLGAALNSGLQQCQYELVARMDSDDISLPNRFERQIDFFRLNPDVVLLSGYISEFKYNPEDIQSVRKVPLNNDEIADCLKWRNAFNHVTVIFKKSSVLSVGGYNDKLTYFEDYDLWIRLVQAQYKVGNIPEILVNVRIGNDMIGRRHGLAYAKKEMSFFSLQKERGFISGSEYCLLILLRIPLRLIPQNMLICLYQFLRHRKVTATQ
jgi:glycosyltransferase involved in cell wall biosynthesis